MQQVQIIQNPEEFANLILTRLENKIENLKTLCQPKEPVELLTRAETSSLLKINLTTLWNWTKQNKLVSYSIGNRVYYKRSEVMDAIIKLKH
jgi:hypothetical protein